MSTALAFSARGLGVRLGRHWALQGIDVDIPAGAWTAVVGPNGAGKSTLLKALAGLQTHQGEVALLDRPLARWQGTERARCVAWLGQNEAVTSDLTAYDVAMLGRLPHQGWLAEQALKATQAWDWRDRPLGALSGGERQRVLLARALAVQARVVLMDEPLANLDPPHQADWVQLARDLVAQGRTVVSVLHEVACALHADALLVVDQGRVAHQGATADAATHRAVERVFGHRLSIQQSHGQWVVLLH
jgi:iron complex transport system ATP-binding protein